MSAKGRGSKVVKDENYPTPGWAVKRLIEGVPDLTYLAPAGTWLEPCVGEGAIVAAFHECISPDAMSWETWDIRPECNATTTGDVIEIASSLSDDDRFTVAITNPPFSLAMKILIALQPHCEHLIMLLRLNWLESEERHAQLVGNMPDVYILPNRPPFVGGKTDATAYAWMHWRREPRDVGTVQLLGLTPKDVRYPKEVGVAKKTFVDDSDAQAAMAEVTEGWTGNVCKRCKGHGQVYLETIDNEGTCPDCAGTGDEFGPLAPVQESAPAQEIPVPENVPKQERRRVVLLKRPTPAVGKKLKLTCIPGEGHIDHEGPCVYDASYYDEDDFKGMIDWET